MTLGRSTWIVGLLLAGWTTACTESAPGPSDTGAPECRNFAGSYIPQVGSACSDTKVIGVPLGACVSQDGCDLTIVTNQTTLKGKVTGASFAVSGTITIGTEPLLQECTGTRLTTGGIDLKCTVKAGGEQKATCTIPADLTFEAEGSTSLCCDYNAQDCAAGQRCTAINAGNHSAFPVMPTCIATTGTKKLDEDCARGEVGGLPNLGYDDCAAGLFCSGYGVAAGKSRVCRELCLKATDCPSGRSCQWLGGDVPISGVCVPSCEVFGNTCADAMTCRRYGSVDANGAVKSAGVCEAVGKKAIGEACGSGPDCQAGLYCNGGLRKCVSYCDDQHPCDGGLTCNKFGGEPAGSTLGFCSLAPSGG